MNIGLITQFYPPQNTEGIPRQRQALAEGLVELGHTVHVVATGRGGRARQQNGVWIHEIEEPVTPLSFGRLDPGMDGVLTRSQLVYERVRDIHRNAALDVVDTPLWTVMGFHTVLEHESPVVVWLQTTQLQLIEMEGRQPTRWEADLAGLEQECLRRATAIIGDSASILQEADRLYDFSGAGGGERLYRLASRP